MISLFCSIFFTLTCNQLFWGVFLNETNVMDVNTWLLILCASIFMTGFQWFFILFIPKPIFKGVMISLFMITSIVVYFINIFHVYIDPSMIENVLYTNSHESIELLQWRMLPYILLLGVVPSLIIYKVKINTQPWLSTLFFRIFSILVAFSMTVGIVLTQYNNLVPLLKGINSHYLITPYNYIASSLHAYIINNTINSSQKIKIGEDAHQRPHQLNSKPRIIILVIGETVRASNWGLNGYQRQTTPELAKHPLINFTKVTSCGTSTAISIPCMFSPYGLHDYDKKRIKQSESLLHILQHAKIPVLWRDNQAGCQGVCDKPTYKHTLCKKWQCYDSALFHHLQKKIKNTTTDQLIVLHMLGNHGPGYFKRYPNAFKYWQPTCDTYDITKCSKQSIINTYDNVILYTDTLLAQTIDKLSSIHTHDTALIYLSDHGESLGENNQFLHGMPYNIAPKEQKKVPMIMWLSKGLMKQLKLQENCLYQKQTNPISHDFLFSTILGLFDIQTQTYDSTYDLTYTCRNHHSNIAKQNLLSNTKI